MARVSVVAAKLWWQERQGASERKEGRGRGRKGMEGQKDSSRNMHLAHRRSRTAKWRCRVGALHHSVGC